MEKPITLTVLSTDTRAEIRDTITAGDSDAYPLSITFSDLTAITGTVRFRFVRGDDYWDRDATVAGNVASLMLEPAFYAATGTELWVSFEDSNLYTPLHVYFRDIRVPGGNVEASTSQPYPSWVAEVAEAEADRVEAESARDDAEVLRMGAESDRMDAEVLRKSAEADRVDAEANRAVWEEFDPLDVYAVGNKVYYLGSSYIMHTASGVAGTLPTDTDYWAIIVQKGDAGEMTIGMVTTLAPGESATVTNSGTSTDAVLNLGIPAGYDGSAVPIDDASSAADRVLSASYIKAQLSAIVSTVVAASNSVSKSAAAFVCTGTNDEETLQAAVNSLPADGGRIYLMAGNYEKGNAAGIELPSNVTIEISAGASLKLADGIDADACFFTNADKVNGNNNINIVGDGKIDCNFRSQLSTTYQYLADFELVSNSRIDIYINNYTMLEAKLKNSKVDLINRKFQGKRVVFAPCEDVAEFDNNGTSGGTFATVIDGGIVGANCVRVSINNETSRIGKVIPSEIATDFDAYEIGVYMKIDVPSAITSIVIGADTGSGSEELTLNLTATNVGKLFEAGKWAYIRAPLNRYIISGRPVFRFNIASNAAANIDIDYMEFIPAPLKPAISWVWDDAVETATVSTVLGVKVLSAYGHRGAIGQMGPHFVGASTYMTEAQLDEVHNEYGWDIAVHHDTHFTSGVALQDAIDELVEVKTYIERNGWRGSQFLLFSGHNTRGEITSQAKKIFSCIRNPNTEKPVSRAGRITYASQFTTFATPNAVLQSVMRRHIWYHPYSHHAGALQSPPDQLRLWGTFWQDWGLLSQCPSEVIGDYNPRYNLHI